MRIHFKLIIITICFSVLLISNPSYSEEASTDRALIRDSKEAFDRGLIVLASTSMTNALHEVLKNFSRERNISISSTFSSTEDLANGIEDGDPANIFISEDPSRMRDLQRKGVLNVFSLSEIAGDELVVIMPKNHYARDKVDNVNGLENKLKFLMNNSIMAIPDPTSDPAGKYITQALEIMDLKKLSDIKTIKTDNNRRALYLASNANNTAIVYASDAFENKDIDIIAKIPQKFHDNIIYQAAIVAEISN